MSLVQVGQVVLGQQQGLMGTEMRTRQFKREVADHALALVKLLHEAGSDPVRVLQLRSKTRTCSDIASLIC